MFSYFTTASANAALGDVISRYRVATRCRAEVMRLEQMMQVAASADAGMEEYVRIKQELNSRVTEFHRAVEDLEKTGVVIKSLEDGLLDFPARRFGEDVWLCWKDGETQIRFWHEKYTGFMGRKPVEVSDESLV